MAADRNSKSAFLYRHNLGFGEYQGLAVVCCHDNTIGSHGRLAVIDDDAVSQRNHIVKTAYNRCRTAGRVRCRIVAAAYNSAESVSYTHLDVYKRQILR